MSSSIKKSPPPSPPAADRAAQLSIDGTADAWSLRIAASDGERRAPGSALPERPAGLRGELQVLIVDDNRDAAESLAMLLQLDGHHARVAHDGVEALAVVGEFSPEVAFLDIGLPGMDGYQLATALRARFGPALLLVALTGWGGDDDRQRALARGFDVHLVKPADPLDIDRLLVQRAHARHRP